ncbi:hypothetical protein C4588_02790 [Candidatus Parcubacteria bacterium]|nr:MAG: hypothetical protein C4588_02790 [Candidatus Parcubacteria bacterium]
MGYRKITNLQLDHPLFLFKQVYALEKIHGTSTHLTFTFQDNKWQYQVFSGGIKHPDFLFMLNTKYRLATDVIEKLTQLTAGQDVQKIVIYGEGYGGRCQGMSDVYGPLNFVAFEVCKISTHGEHWLDVSRAARFVELLGLPFVFYELGPATPEWLNEQRNRPSEQAKRNGLGDNQEGEGIVIRAPMELVDENGGRMIAKYKREGFRETATARPLTEAEIQERQDAQGVAEEWVVEERLNHVLSALVAKGHSKLTLKDTRLVMDTMIEDVSIEALGKIVWSESVGKAIGARAAELFKNRIRSGGIINPVEGVSAGENA